MGALATGAGVPLLPLGVDAAAATGGGAATGIVCVPVKEFSDTPGGSFRPMFARIALQATSWPSTLLTSALSVAADVAPAPACAAPCSWKFRSERSFFTWASAATCLDFAFDWSLCAR